MTEWNGNSLVFKTYLKGGGEDGKSPKDGNIKGRSKIRDFQDAAQFDCFGAILNDDFVDISFDTEEMSAAFWKMAEQNKWNCLILENLENGHIHSFWRSEKHQIRGGKDKKLAVGLIADIHGGATYVPLRVFGSDRFPPSFEPAEIDEVPNELLPVKTEMNLWGMDNGKGRNDTLYSYILILQKQLQLDNESIRGILRNTNEYIFSEPLSKDELEIILRDEAFPKQTDKNLSHVTIGDEIISSFSLIAVNGDFYNYESGVYRPFPDGRITAFMSEKYPAAKISLKREVVDYIRGKTYREAPQDSTAINVKNCILYMSPEKDDSGKITGVTVDQQAHTPENISFKQFNAEYHPEITCDKLETAVSMWFNGEAEEIELFKQLLGYLMMNHVNYEKIFFFIGLPSTGKSALLDIIQFFCGKENVSAITLNDMNESFGLEPLINKTVNIFGDIPKTKLLKTDKFKMLADGSPINIKRKYKQPVTYCFTGKLIFGMNQFPDMSNDFAGVERRLIIFRFNHVFKKGVDDNPNIKDELKTPEAMSALLNMALEGYKSLLVNGGFISTKKSEQALEEFVSENDSVIQWLHEAEITEDYLLREPISMKPEFTGLYPEYKAFCLNAGEQAKEQKDFSREICNKYGFKTATKRFGDNRRAQMFVKI